MPTVPGAARAGLRVATSTITTGVAQTAVSRADAAVFAGGAGPIAATLAEPTILRACAAGLRGAALAVAAGVTTAAVERAGETVFGVPNTAEPITAGIAAAAIVSAARAILIISALTITATRADTAVYRAARAGFITLADSVTAALAAPTVHGAVGAIFVVTTFSIATAWGWWRRGRGRGRAHIGQNGAVHACVCRGSDGQGRTATGVCQQSKARNEKDAEVKTLSIAHRQAPR